MSLALNLAINNVSFGQVSTLILRELISKNKKFTLFPIGPQIDLTSQANITQDFAKSVQDSISLSLESHSRKDKIFKLWHINGSLESFSEKQILFSFYELDSPTKTEVNIVKNNDKVIFSSNYTVDIYKSLGCKNIEFVPLAFDKYNFKRIDKKYFIDNRITFNLCGKLEKRKHHKKLIQAWLKKYGNNKKYFLQCAIFNPFLKPEDNQALFASILENKNYFNINFINYMPNNSSYNDFLNSGDIVIGMSGGEGWGLPEFHSIALGKHGVILNAHAYKDWANSHNSVLIEPNGKLDATDNMFFHKNSPFNQGNIFDFNSDDFINGCEEAIKRVESNRLNQEGLKLQDQFNSEKLLDRVLSYIE